MIELQSHTSIENSLVKWLRYLTAKQVIWVQFLLKSLNFLKFPFVQFVLLNENYEKTRLTDFLIALE